MKGKKYFDDKWYSKILQLIKNKMFYDALLETESYLNSFPYDVCARTTYASLLINYRRIEEAEMVIDDTVITKKTVEKDAYEILMVKFKLLCYQRKYEECYQLFLENESLLKDKFTDYYNMLAFLQTRLGLEVTFNEDYYSYTIRQLISYSEESALEHIKNKHVDNFDVKDASCFYSDFPVEEVYYKLRSMLPLVDSDACFLYGRFRDVYIFKFDNNGRNFSRKSDYIKVICIKDTNDIITMHPYDKCLNLSFIDLKLDSQKEADEEVKVKRLSQIEKFNQRYNKN